MLACDGVRRQAEQVNVVGRRSREDRRHRQGAGFASSSTSRSMTGRSPEFLSRRNGALLGVDIAGDRNMKQRYVWEDGQGVRHLGLRRSDSLFMAGVFTPKRPDPPVGDPRRRPLPRRGGQPARRREPGAREDRPPRRRAARGEGHRRARLPGEAPDLDAAGALDQAVADLDEMLRYAAHVIAAVAIVIFIGLANATSMAVRERVREVGMPRSLGFSRRTGRFAHRRRGVLAVARGWPDPLRRGLPDDLARRGDASLRLLRVPAGNAPLAAVPAAAAAGLVGPRRRIARRHPREPEADRRGPAERPLMKGVPLKYSVRNLLRRPVRTLLTVLGLSLLTALIVFLVVFGRSFGRALRVPGDPRVLIALSQGAQTFEFSSITLGPRPPRELRGGRPRHDAGLRGAFAGALRLREAEAAGDRPASPRGPRHGIRRELAATLLPGFILTEGRLPVSGQNEVISGRNAASRLRAPDTSLAPGDDRPRRQRGVHGRRAVQGAGDDLRDWILADPEDLRQASRRTDYSFARLKVKEGVDVKALGEKLSQDERYELRVLPEEVYSRTSRRGSRTSSSSPCSSPSSSRWRAS